MSKQRKASTTKYDRALKIAQAKSPPPKRAYDLLVAADKEGDARATYALATWYLFGSPFTEVDHKRGAQLLKRAAENGIAEAAHDLAVCYEKGEGVKKSEARAFALYVQAALLGDSQSFYEVGRMYYWGIGVARNRRLANVWLDKAESLGITD